MTPQVDRSDPDPVACGAMREEGKGYVMTDDALRVCVDGTISMRSPLYPNTSIEGGRD
jgi:hypothetical protein